MPHESSVKALKFHIQCLSDLKAKRCATQNRPNTSKILPPILKYFSFSGFDKLVLHFNKILYRTCFKKMFPTSAGRKAIIALDAHELKFLFIMHYKN